MSLIKISLIVLISLIMGLAMVNPSHAQNAPQDYLNAHNAARAQVGVSNIVWDNTVAAYAQNYANSRISDCNLVHSNGPYGENLAKGSSSSMTGTAAVNLWVAEKPYYDYGSNTCTGGKQCLHYTQVVWQNSVRVGCARVQCTNGWWFVTCNYDPPGNYIGQKPY
ncbi:pathogenesis-related protein 1B-like [Mercurialis annua]|uniref:pathogenesis-related protein 1B-like n=1 Tax=Mercurialis annua TaxID=3986 RepID=UPI00215FCAA6|nr:pathogenesis-related protein 1B-like [Mercurialis annua]